MFLSKIAKVATVLTGLTIAGSLEIANAQVIPPGATPVYFPVYYHLYPQDPHQALTDAVTSCENTKNQVDSNLYITTGCFSDLQEELPPYVYFTYTPKY